MDIFDVFLIEIPQDSTKHQIWRAICSHNISGRTPHALAVRLLLLLLLLLPS
jgi:hypothetical protein